MLKDLSPFSPASFFASSHKIKKDQKKKIHSSDYLPNMSGILNEDSFADVALLWSLQGLRVHVEVDKPLENVLFPKYREGDSIELFFDTRDLKTVQSVTCFCHHFVFLPEEIDGVKVHEVTRFRSDESHELADPSHFVIQTEVSRKSYSMDIHIPKQALHAYDPKTFKHLGFAYRINRAKGDPQHFAVSSRFFSLEKHPELWASLTLANESS